MSFHGDVNREPIEARRQEEIRFCRYRLDALLSSREQNHILIAAVEQRLRELESA